MKYRIILLVLVAFSATFVAAAEKEPLCSFAQSAIADASRIRGLKQKKKVSCLAHNRDQVKQYLLSAINEKIPAQKLENEQTIYRALGFVPRDYNYKDGIIELYLSQIGGYYDPEKKHFVMAAWMPAMLQTTVAVHELTHALQDQYYDLEHFMDSKTMDTDMLFARSALVEGDATAVMTDYSRELFGQGSLSAEASVQNLMLQNVVGASLIGAGNNIPPSLQFMLIFPYTSGLRFAHTLLKQGGYPAVDEAFKRPPRSTEEILHPDKYFKDAADFKEVTEADLLVATGEGGKVVYGDVLGEFAISALLSGLLPAKSQAIEAAAGWAGDRVGIVEQAGKERVVWLTFWDSAGDAEEFLAAMKVALAAHYGSDFKKRVALLQKGESVSLVVSQ